MFPRATSEALIEQYSLSIYRRKAEEVTDTEKNTANLHVKQQPADKESAASEKTIPFKKNSKYQQKFCFLHQIHNSSLQSLRADVKLTLLC